MRERSRTGIEWTQRMLCTIYDEIVWLHDSARIAVRGVTPGMLVIAEVDDID